MQAEYYANELSSSSHQHARTIAAFAGANLTPPHAAADAHTCPVPRARGVYITNGTCLFKAQLERSTVDDVSAALAWFLALDDTGLLRLLTCLKNDHSWLLSIRALALKSANTHIQSLAQHALVRVLMAASAVLPQLAPASAVVQPPLLRTPTSALPPVSPLKGGSGIAR